MALVLKEREAEEATGRRRELERRPEERNRLSASEEAIEIAGEDCCLRVENGFCKFC